MKLVLNTYEFMKLIKRNMFTIKRMADELGISRSQLWRVINKKCCPGEQFIAGFKKAFPDEDLNKFFLLNPLQGSDTLKV